MHSCWPAAHNASCDGATPVDDCDIHSYLVGSEGTCDGRDSARHRGALVVATHADHAFWYCRLLHSIIRHVEDLPTLQLVTVFSTRSEVRSMWLERCQACAITRPLHAKHTVFDLAPKPGQPKYNLQSAKKLFGLMRAQAPWSIVLDSDMLVLRAVHIGGALQTFGRVLYVPPLDAQHRLAYSDRTTLAQVNALLNGSWRVFPLELPWVYESARVRELSAFLASRWGDSYWARLLSFHSPSGRLFIELVYRLFVWSAHPAYWTLVRVPGAYVRRAEPFLYASLVSDEQRTTATQPPSPAIQCKLQRLERAPLSGASAVQCAGCWLQIHADKECPCMPTRPQLDCCPRASEAIGGNRRQSEAIQPVSGGST